MSERHLDSVQSARLTSAASTTSALLAAYLWNSQPDGTEIACIRACLYVYPTPIHMCNQTWLEYVCL